MNRLRIGAVLTMSLTAVMWAGGGGSAAAQQGSEPSFGWQESLKGRDSRLLRSPIAIAAAGDQELGVVDVRGSRLFVFRDLAGGAGWQVDAVVELPAPPMDVTFDGARYLLSLRGEDGLLAVERPLLQLRRLPLPAGVVPGRLDSGPGGTLWLHDLNEGRLLRLDAAGEIDVEMAVCGRVMDVVASSDGGVYVVLAEPARVQRFGGNGERLSDLPVPGVDPKPAWPSGLVVEPDGRMIVVDRHGGSIAVLDAGGRLLGRVSRPGWEPGLLRFPAGLTLLPDGRLAVANEGDGRIEIFRPVGGPKGP